MELAKEKRVHFFLQFIWRKFISQYVLSHCITYWTNFQNMHTSTYQKTLPRSLFCLFLKSPKAFSVFLRRNRLYSRNSFFELVEAKQSLPIKKQTLRAVLQKSVQQMEYFFTYLKIIDSHFSKKVVLFASRKAL